MGKKNLVIASAALAAGMALMATTAQAGEELQFQFTGSSGAFTWDMYSSPTPFKNPGGYAQYFVTGTADPSIYWGPGADTAAPIVFVDIADGFIQVDTASNYYTFTNTPLTAYFTGTYGAPTFAPGVSYHWSDQVGGDSLVISTVPEPAAWALMLVGFAGLGGALRASRKSLAARAA